MGIRTSVLALLWFTLGATCVLGKSDTAQENCSSSALPKEWFSPLNSQHGLVDYNTEQPPGWGACFGYSRATCCEKNQTDSVFRTLLMMDRASVSKPCQMMTETVLCALGCDPDVGLGRIPAQICSDRCDQWYDACKDDFFSPTTGSMQKIPTPCSEHAMVCFRLGDVYKNGHELCDAMAVRWSDDRSQCVTGAVDAHRRGSPIPVTVKKTTTASSTGPPGLVDLFLRDMRQLGAFVQKYTRDI